MSEPSSHTIGNEQSINDCTSKAMKSRDHLQSNIFIRGFRKPQGKRTRWYIFLAAAVLIILLAVVAITLAIYFGTGEKDDNTDEARVETFNFGPGTPKTTSTTGKKVPTKHTPEYRSTSDKVAFSTGTSSFATTTISSTEFKMDKQPTKPVSLPPSTKGMTTAGRTPTDHATTLRNETTQTTSKSFHSSTIITTEDKTHKTTKSTSPVSTLTVTEHPPRPSLSIQSNDIDLPYSNSMLTISCVTTNAQNWREMRIYHEIEDTITTIVVVKSYLGSPNVEINSNFTSEVSYKEDALLLTIHAKEMDCSYLGNYTCLLMQPERTYKNTTRVKAVNKKDSKPTLTVSTSVVENTAATIKCAMELIEPNVTIFYKFRPPGLDKYFNLSLTPNITRTWTGCSLLIESTLTMVSKMHDNGSVFMCEVTTYRNNAITTYTSEAEFHVIPKTYCDDKNQFSLYPHPYESCTSVVYCYVSGPQVYKINCGAGYCYDTNKTDCVKTETMDNVTAITDTTTPGYKTTNPTNKTGGE
ncbi:uncharacterized protein LOC111130720 isoform X2 [Crassostrea virginica]